MDETRNNKNSKKRTHNFSVNGMNDEQLLVYARDILQCYYRYIKYKSTNTYSQRQLKKKRIPLHASIHHFLLACGFSHNHYSRDIVMVLDFINAFHEFENFQKIRQPDSNMQRERYAVLQERHKQTLVALEQLVIGLVNKHSHATMLTNDQTMKFAVDTVEESYDTPYDSWQIPGTKIPGSGAVFVLH